MNCCPDCDRTFNEVDPKTGKISLFCPECGLPGMSEEEYKTYKELSNINDEVAPDEDKTVQPGSEYPSYCKEPLKQVASARNDDVEDDDFEMVVKDYESVEDEDEFAEAECWDFKRAAATVGIVGSIMVAAHIIKKIKDKKQS